MPQPETYRTFIALPLSPEITKKLDGIQRTLRRRCPEHAVSWVKPANIHVTLFFLGDILPIRQPPVEKALSVVARNVRPFTFDVQHLGAFPNANRPRVVWVGVDDPSGQLALLHRAVNEALERAGFQPEKRRFSPHLTLGRIRRRASREDVHAVGEVVRQTEVGNLGQVPVERMIFFRSVLKPSGAEYAPLAEFELAG